MPICRACRVAMRTRLASSYAPPLRSMSTKSTVKEILAKPSWSIRSLLDSQSTTPSETITSAQLNHLLRLAALPPPGSKAEEDSMIATLQSQLQFVRAIQNVDTKDVEPLRAIRDETEDGMKEVTIGLDNLKEMLSAEERVGFYKRPRRVKGKIESDAEKWDALATASRKAGKYFVVQSEKASSSDQDGSRSNPV